MPNGTRITDGSLSFEGGIDSGRPSTLASEANPTGLKRNQLAWATNATMRGGGVSCRTGFQPVAQNQDWPGLFQGAFMYRPDAGYPYIVLAVGGRLYRVMVGTDNSAWEITGVDWLDASQDQYWFEQAEQFLVVQDGINLPLIWDGAAVRRSVGLTGAPTPEIPVGTCMDYYMGRLWVANGYDYGAGDIVFGPSGTGPYANRDAVLKWTENAYLAGGGLFSVPSPASTIRALKHTANLNTALGQGELLIFCRDRVFAMDVPTNRTDWGNLSQVGNNYPIQKVALIGDGSFGDRCIVHSNSDLHYRSPTGINSLLMAIRYFQQWGNTPISREMNRVLQLDDRSMLRFASGINFDNRLLQTCLPTQGTRGIYHRGIAILDYDLVSSIGEKLPPAWEGMYEGLRVLQLVKGDFGGRDRAFAIVESAITGAIDIWEVTDYSKRDNGDNRITWFVETPSYTWGSPFEVKKLNSLELWFDNMVGTVEFRVYYRVDQDPCWRFWHAWDQCSARTCEEDPTPCVLQYPAQDYCAQYRATMILPEPPSSCEQGNSRPTDIGYQFQLRIEVKGWCRLRGLLIHAVEREEAPFDGMVC